MVKWKLQMLKAIEYVVLSAAVKLVQIKQVYKVAAHILTSIKVLLLRIKTIIVAIRYTLCYD